MGGAHNRSHARARARSQPAVGAEGPPQLLGLGLRQRLQRRAAGSPVEAKPLHGLLEGGHAQLPGHLATESRSQRSDWRPSLQLLALTSDL